MIKLYDIVSKLILRVNRQLKVQDECCNTLPSINREFGYIVNLRKKLLEVLCNLNRIFKNNDLYIENNFSNLKKENIDTKQLKIAATTLETIGQSKSMRHPLLNSVYITLSTEATLLKRLINVFIHLIKNERHESLFQLWMAEMEFNAFQNRLKDKFCENTPFYEWLFKFKSCIYRSSMNLLLNINGDKTEYTENEIISSAHIYYLIDEFVRSTNSFVALLLYPEVPTMDSFKIICESGIPPGNKEHIDFDSRPYWKINLVSLLMLDHNIDYYYDNKLDITFFIKQIKEKELYVINIYKGEVKQTEEKVHEFFSEISGSNSMDILFSYKK